MRLLRRLACQHNGHQHYMEHPSGAILCVRCKQVWR